MTTRPRAQLVLRLLAVVTAHIVVTIGIAALYPSTGRAAGALGMLPTLAGAWCFGLRGGLVAAAVQVTATTLLLRFGVDPPAVFNWPAYLGMAVSFILGAGVGRQRDLSRKLRDELAEKERLRVREQETLEAIPDPMIRVGADGGCRLRGTEILRALPEAIERAVGVPLPGKVLPAVSELVAQVRESHFPQVSQIELSDARSFDVRCLPAADDSVLLMLREITEEQTLRRQVTGAEHLASLGTLAAGLAHEINNPLTYVITSISAIGSSAAVRGNSSVNAEVDAALQGCWRIRDLVRDFLETTRGKDDKVTSVSVPEVLDAALALVKQRVRHRATIACEHEGVPHAHVHRTKLVQVVVNLVVNASQALVDGHASENTIGIRAYGEGEEVVIKVVDNGPGMDPETRAHACEPFFTTKAPGQGTGLGLFLCSSIVKSLGGSLELESEPARGTTVTVRVPRARAEPTAGRSRPAPGELDGASQSARRCRVLVVDDEQHICRALRRQLGRVHAVSTCANGREALEYFNAGERFDVILCDLLMPEMTGIQLYDELRQRSAEQADRMVFLTGGATTEAAREFVERNAARVLHKPFEPGQIEAALAVVLSTACDAEPPH